MFDIKKVANLAKLSFSESEEIELQSDLNEIIKMANSILNIDTTNIKPLFSTIDDFELDNKNFNNLEDKYFESCDKISYQVPKIII